jgi:hypothetical protein
MAGEATVQFFRNGQLIVQPERVIPGLMVTACREHGIDPRELAAIGKRLIRDEDAREFSDLVGVEIVLREPA